MTLSPGRPRTSEPMIDQGQIVWTLNQQQYAELEKKVTNTMVTSATTELEAGHKLGIQHVLSILRNGFVRQA